MELKIKILLEKLTQVISQSGMKHGLYIFAEKSRKNKGSIFSQGTVVWRFSETIVFNLFWHYPKHHSKKVNKLSTYNMLTHS